MEQIKMLNLKNFDEDLAKRVFRHIIRDYQIVDLQTPPNPNKKLSLGRLLKLGYSGEIDVDALGPSANGNFCPTREWSQMFHEDGRLRLDEILPLLPPQTSILHNERGVFFRSLMSAVKGLAHYHKEHKSCAEYEVVAPLRSRMAISPDHSLVLHANFLAKPKNASLCYSELFFVEVLPRTSPEVDYVVRNCSILKPYPTDAFPGNITTYGVGGIFHPVDIPCACSLFNGVD